MYPAINLLTSRSKENEYKTPTGMFSISGTIAERRYRLQMKEYGLVDEGRHLRNQASYN